MRQSPISVVVKQLLTLSQLLTLYVYIGPKAVGLSYSNIGKFQGKFNTANPQTRNKKPSNNNKKKPLKKPSLKSTFAPTKEEIDRRPIVFFDITIDGVPADPPVGALNDAGSSIKTKVFFASPPCNIMG